MGERVVPIVLGSTFRATWVASGAVANPIVYNIRSGSETLVGSWAGTSSGNGAYYADVAIGTPGLWKGEWYATVGGNSYRNTEYLAVFPGDADQPGRYITWDDVVNRFNGFADIADAVKAASHYLSYAEAYVDGELAAFFTTPFSRNNVTIRDLVIDVVYMRGIRGKSDEYKDVRADVTSRIAALRDGCSMLITTSGDVIGVDRSADAWSSTRDYPNVMPKALDQEFYAIPSSQQAYDEAVDRGFI